MELNQNRNMHVQNLGYPLLLKIAGPKQPFYTTLQLNSNIKGQYLWNQDWIDISLQGIGNYLGSPSFQKFMNFGLQMA